MASKLEWRSSGGGCISLRGFELDLDRRELRTADGSPAPLRRKVLDALFVLAEQAGHVVSKEALIARVWPDAVVTDDSLTQLMNELRRGLGDTDRSLVRTVARRGYVLAISRVTPEVLPRRADAPSLPSTNLPPLNVALIGRQADLTAVADLVLHHRLVTIAGAGGIGKTTLAIAVARRLLDRFAHGVWWVDLSVLSDPAQVALAVAAAVGIELKQGDPRRRLAFELSGRELLLVFDNCEHLVAEVAAVVSTLVDSDCAVKVLATSQESLKAGGERLYRLGVLEVPPEGASLGAAAGFGAFALLAQRAAEIDQRFSLDESNVALAIDICRQLDGVALAIEMAAARMPMLGVGGVHALLGDRLRVLRNTRRMVPSRQETLRATLEWSCSMLSENELAALRRSSVFAGSFDAELATQVIAEDADDAWWVLDAICALVDRSLLHVERRDPARYRLPESTRLLAREMLAQADEVEAVETLYRQAMVGIGSSITPAFLFQSEGDAEVIDRYGAFYADLEQAFTQACRHADAEAGAAILVGLRSLDALRGETESMRGRLEKCLPLLPAHDCPARARILTVVASCGWLTIDSLSARDAAAAAVQAWGQLDTEPHSLSHALLLLATESARDGACQAAHAALAQAQRIVAGIGKPRLRLNAAIHAGHVAMFCGSPDTHLQHMQDALALAHELGASRAACYIQAFLPGAALMAGHASLAVSLGSQAAHEMRMLGQRTYLAGILVDLVRALIDVGDMDRCRCEAAEALPLAWEYGLQAEMARHMALLALRLGRAIDGATLLGYAMARCPQPRNELESRTHADGEAIRQLAEHSLGSTTATEAIGSGLTLSNEEAFTLASAISCA